MLQFFRSLLSSKVGAIVALVFLALIALAFASGDIANTGSFGGLAGGDRVATVGKERIDTSTLSQAATSAVERAKQNDPRSSMQSFLAAGGLDQVLDSLVSQTAVAVFGKKHGIVASDRLVDSEITKIDAFKGPDGNFSEPLFRQAIQQRGLSEKLVRDDLAQGLISRQILLPAGFGASVPREFALRYATLLTENREGTIALLPSAAFVTKTQQPTEAELSTFYASHRDRFIRPERRVIRYAAFTDAALKSVPAPTEAEIAKAYNDRRAEYAALESRRFTQLIVPTEAAARAVIAEASKGASLDAVARTKGLTTAKIGPIAKTALVAQASQAVADAAFAAPANGIAAPARSGLGWHVLHVDGIEKRAERTLDQVRGELTAQVAAQKRRAALGDFTAKLEEEFDNGANLADVAKELGLTLEQTVPITADGRSYADTSKTVPAILARTVQTAFAMERENEPQLAEVDPGKAFVIFDVTDIAPSAPAPLAEIKGDVTQAYLLSKGAAAARVAAQRVEAEVRKGTPLAAAMTALGLPLPPVEQVQMNRQQLTAGGRQIPPPLALMFSMAEGTVKTLPVTGERGFFVVSLKKIEPGKVAANDPILAAAQRELGGVVASEYAEQMRRAIRDEVGTTRNEAAIKAVRTQLGGGGN